MIVSPPLLQAIRAEVEAGYPEEACGLLVGSAANGEVRVQTYHPVRNRRADDGAAGTRFLIGPDEYRAAAAAAASAGLEVVGVYHSHPDSPPRPSAYDREQAWPWYEYLIVSVMRGAARHARVWQLRDDRRGFVARRLDITAA